MHNEEFTLNAAEKARERERLGVAGTFFDTSELELLISAASIFSLLQLPGLLNQGMDYARIHLPDMPLAVVGFFYLTMIVYTLVISFLAHVAVRVFWIAMLGLHSVMPGPVPWDKLNIGPLSRQYSQKNWPTLERLIYRSDQISSLIFSVTVTLVIMIAYSMLLVLLIALLGLAVSKVTDLDNSMVLLYVALVAFSLPGIATSVIDEIVKKRPHLIEQRPRLVKVWNWVYGFYSTLTLAKFYGPVMYKFMTRVSRWRLMVFLFTCMFGVIGLVTTTQLVRIGKLEVGSYAYFETKGEQVLDPKHYASMHDQSGRIRFEEPFIDAPLVKDPYLRVFLPYVPDYEAVLKKRCPPLPSADDEDGAEALAAARLKCLSSLYKLELDGKPLSDQTFLFHRDSKTGRRGLVTYIPVADMASGRHDLVVTLALAEDDADDTDLSERQQRLAGPHFMPFWR